MPPKRPHPDGNSNGSGDGTSRKQQRIAQRRDARQIDTQSSNVGSAAPSSSSSSALPPQLDVEQSLSTRKFEILSLLKAMKNARNASSTRAWQLLPRHARRRAASHNILRLPTRLRNKGLAELRASTTTPKSRSDVRKRLATHPKSKSLARKEELVERAGRNGKRWLESHLWFAKRFRMSREEFDGQRWGFIMPEEPSMKGKRTDWRAMHSGCALFDSSWDQWLRFSVKLPKQDSNTQQASAQALLHQVLHSAGISLPDGFQSGSVYHTALHSGNPGPSNRVQCPVSVYAVASGSAASQAPQHATPSPTSESRPPSNHSRHLRKTLALLPPPPPLSELHPDYEVLLRVHPAAVKEVTTSLKKALAKAKTAKGVHFVLNRLQGPDASTLVGLDRKGKDKNTKPNADEAHHLSTQAQRTIESRLLALKRQSLRSKAYNVFELYGPLTGSVLGGVLRPASSTDASTSRAWKQLTTSRTQLAESWDQAIVLNLRVHDPRLGYPYRNTKIIKRRDRDKQEDDKKSSAAIATPSHTQHDLFRDGMNPPKYTKGDLDRRRAKALVPGSKLEPDSQDDVIPIVLVQRSAPPTRSASDAFSHCLAGYTFILPQHWSRPFLHSLLSTSVRPLSLSGHRILHLEAGLPSYPHDWIGSPGWHDVTEHDFAKRQMEWLKRPPAKRVNFEKLDVMWPFGGQAMWLQLAKQARKLLDQMMNMNKMSDTQVTAETTQVHITGSKSVLNQQIQSVHHLLLNSNPAAVQRARQHLSSPRTSSISSSPFVIVRLEAIQRGALEDVSEVRVPNGLEEMRNWVKASRGIDNESDDDVSVRLDSTTHVGSITSGAFSLSRGKGFAMGGIAQHAWVFAVAMYQVACPSGTEGRQISSTILAVRHTRGGPPRLVKAECVFL